MRRGNAKESPMKPSLLSQLVLPSCVALLLQALSGCSTTGGALKDNQAGLSPGARGVGTWNNAQLADNRAVTLGISGMT
jgi:hypothetical protein